MRRRLENADLTPDLIKQSSAILKILFKEDLGAEFPFDSGGRSYVAVLERHWRAPGSSTSKPCGPHKGVSLFFADDGVPAPAMAPASGSAFRLGATSRLRLQGVHPDLVRVVEHAIAITPLDFTVVEGVRSQARQNQLYAAGATRTLKSKHLTGRAVDLAPFEFGMIHWDWPRFNRLGPIILRAAAEVSVGLRWGGNWKGFPDGPHFEMVNV